MSSRKSSILRFPVLFLGAVLSVSAQGGLGGLESGIVFDAGTGAIRAILGVPGGASLGPALASGLEWASIAPSGKLALGFADSRVFLFRRAADLSLNGMVLEEGCGAPSKAAWSTDSDSVVVYWREAGRLMVWDDLREEPRATELEPLEGVSALAIASEGAPVVVGAAAGVYSVEAGEAPRLLVPVVVAGAISFARGGSDLFIADLAGKQVVEIVDFRGAATVVPLAGPDGGLSEPVGLAVSADGRRLFVADKAEQCIRVIDLESRAPLSRISLEFTPEQLDPLPGGAIFMLKSGAAGGDPFQVFADTPEPAVFFIPAAQLPVEVQ